MILTADFMGREYRASRSRTAACFLMRLCVSYDNMILYGRFIRRAVYHVLRTVNVNNSVENV